MIDVMKTEDGFAAEPTRGPIAELAGALAKAQAELKNATLNKINPHFKSKYADLAAIRDATAPTLAKHGLSVVQFTGMQGDMFVLFTRLLHSSGEYLESMYPLPMATEKPQVMGSALTYARRYSWSAMCGISADEDDDANAAQEGGKAVEKISDDQKERLVSLLQDTDTDTKKFLQHFKIDALDNMPAQMFAQAESMLAKKAKKMDDDAKKEGDA